MEVKAGPTSSDVLHKVGYGNGQQPLQKVQVPFNRKDCTQQCCDNSGFFDHLLERHKMERELGGYKPVPVSDWHRMESSLLMLQKKAQKELKDLYLRQKVNPFSHQFYSPNNKNLKKEVFRKRMFVHNTIHNTVHNTVNNTSQQIINLKRLSIQQKTRRDVKGAHLAYLCGRTVDPFYYDFYASMYLSRKEGVFHNKIDALTRKGMRQTSNINRLVLRNPPLVYRKEWIADPFYQVFHISPREEAVRKRMNVHNISKQTLNYSPIENSVSGRVRSIIRGMHSSLCSKASSYVRFMGQMSIKFGAYRVEFAGFP